MTRKTVVGVVGLGTMGLGIVQVYAQAGVNVIATDAFEAARQSAKARLAETLDARVKTGKLPAASRDETLSHVKIVADPAAMGDCNLVIEAIIEKLETKRELFATLESVVTPDAVLATNTSSLSVSAMAVTLVNSARLVGLHFFNPAPVMKLVELVAHPGTSQAALDLARQVTESSGKTVIACADRPGFIVNRCARPFYGEALCLLEEGRSASDIDAAMVAAGYRIGPLSLIDLIGADVHLAATSGVYEGMERNPRYHVFDSLKAQVAKGDLGRKSGKGFVFPASPGPAPADAPDIALRIEATLANEAASLVAEGTVTAADIDTAMKLAMNFPRGPFESAKAHGIDNIISMLSALEDSAPEHLIGRYTISPALKNLA